VDSHVYGTELARLNLESAVDLAGSNFDLPLLEIISLGISVIRLIAVWKRSACLVELERREVRVAAPMLAVLVPHVVDLESVSNRTQERERWEMV
jgi:hypothetical protein